MPSIDEVMKTPAGAHLFNAITRMSLYNADTGRELYFSERYEWTQRFIGQLLESHILPRIFVPVVFKDDNGESA